MIEDYINDTFFNLKFNNVKNNKNRYHDKIIDISITKVCKNIKKYTKFLKNNFNKNNYNILISNDNIFYTGLLIILFGILLDFFIKFLHIFNIF